MKLKFTFLITALLLLGNLTTWGQTTETYQLVTSAPTDWSGDYLIVSNGKALSGGTTSWGSMADVIINNNSTIETTLNIYVTIAKSGFTTDTYTLYMNSNSKFIMEVTSNTFATADAASEDTEWTLTLSTDNDVIIACASTTNRCLRRNSNSGFRSYTSATGTLPKLYKKVASGPTQLTAPTNFSGTPGDQQITFSWTASANASSYTISYSYTPVGESEQTQEVTGVTTNPYTLIGLANNIVYSCKIKAVGDGTSYSDSDYSTPTSVEPTDATLYDINLTQSAGGTIECDKITAAADEVLTLTATPAAGYGLTDISASYGDPSTPLTLSGTDNTRTFTMPASNVEVGATFTAYSITATSNDPSLGSVSLSGNVITATAETGYRIATPSYTVTGGTATVTQNNNEFTVVATSNCTVRINFEAIPTYTVTFNAGTGMATYNSTSYTEPFFITVQENTQIDLLTITITPPTGWTFFGWATASVDATQTTPTIISGTTYTPTADVTLYAVYSMGVGYTLVGESDVTAGTYIIGALRSNSATDNFYFATSTISSGDINTNETSITIEEVEGVRSVATLPDGAQEFTFTGNNTDGFTIGFIEGATTKYLGYTASNSRKLAFGDYSSIKWKAIADDDPLLTNGVSLNNDGPYTISENSTAVGAIRGYASNTVYRAIYLFKKSGTYNTNPSVLNITSNQNMPPIVTSSTDVFVSNNATVTVTENSNIMVNNLTIEEGSKIVIDTLSILDVKGTFTNAHAAGLIIEDGGQLIINNSGVQATVKKNIVGWINDDPNTQENETSGWYLISSPVKNQSIAGMFDEPQNGTITIDLYSYDEPTYTWINYHEGSISESTLIPGKGYLTANQGDVTRQFVGELNNGEIIVNLSYESTHAPIRGFNFVGNPYSQNITLENNATVSTYVATGYYKLVDGALVASENNITIAPKEGFFVRATAVNQTITFNNAPSISKDRANKDQYISIEVNNNTYMDRAYAMFSDVIGLAKVSHLDENAPMVYIPQNGTDYAIASYTDDVNEIPLCFKTPTTGYYTISMKPQGEFNYIHLFDKVENVEIDMLNRGSYEFIGSPKDMENRFTITLNRVNTPNNAVINNFAFISNNELVINNIEGEGTIQIIDIVGRVASQYIVSGSTRISTNELSKGVYMVRLIDNAGSKTQKIVVK